MSRIQAIAAPPTETHARAGGLHAVAPADAASEREADRFAATGTGGGRAVDWSFADVPAHPPCTVPSTTPGLELDVDLGGPGQPLDPALGGPLGLRVHTDADAADTARRAGAEAVTVGRDIVFAPGRYRPGSVTGRRLIAHEVAHAVQAARRPGVRSPIERGAGR